MISLTLGIDDGPRHDLGTAIVFAGQRHTIEFYLNGHLILPALAIQPLDSLTIAVTKYNNEETPSVSIESDSDTISSDESDFDAIDTSERDSADIISGEQEQPLTERAVNSIRCVPIENLLCDELLAYCHDQGEIHYVSFLNSE